jgi:hypothetical protein
LPCQVVRHDARGQPTELCDADCHARILLVAYFLSNCGGCALN